MMASNGIIKLFVDMPPLDPQRDGEIARRHGIAEVFGKVVKGYDDVVKKIEDVGSRPWAKCVPSK